MKKHIVFQVLIALAIVALLVVMIVDLLPLVENVIKDAGDESSMVSYIESYGSKGIPILMGMQALQIIVAVIPSAAIQVLTGLCYGAYWGTLINLAGCVLGNIIVFAGIRQLKDLLAPLFKRSHKHKGIISKEQLEKIKKPELVAFFFFLIPGIPNGIVPYVFAETNLSLKKYLVAVVLGSIPSTFVCTFLGDRVSTGNYTTAIVIAAVVVVIIVAVLLFRKKIMMKITHADAH